MKNLPYLAALTVLLAGCGPGSTTDSQTTKTTTTVTTTTSGTADTTTTAPVATPAVTAPPTSAVLTQANLDRVEDDMSPTQVQAILGAPTSSSTEPIPIVGGTQTTYTYQSANATITIVFKNDLMKEKHGTFGP